MYAFNLVFSFILVLRLQCSQSLNITENETPFKQLPCVQLYIEGNSTTFSYLPPKTKLCVHISDIPPEVRFLVVEAHSQRYNFTISYGDANFPEEIRGSSSNFVEGTGVGLVYLVDVFHHETFWVFNNNPKTVSVMLSVEAYHNKDPIPGGCNMEFPVDISPFLQLNLRHGFTIVEFQHANVGYDPDEPAPSCSDSTGYLSYSVYLYFLIENEFKEEQLFNGLKLMRDVDSIKKYGKLLKPYSISPKTRVSFLTYKGQGVIYNVITRYKMNGTIYEAAYVPITTYGCSFESEVDGCDYLTSSFARFLALCMATCGLFIAIRGHRFLTIEMGFFGFLAFALISFVLLTKYTDIPNADRDVFTMLCGIGGGIVWAFIWWYFGIPVISVLLVGFCLGFLMTSILFFTPFGNLDLLRNNFNYWMLFVSGILMIPVIFLSTTKFLNILACSVVGAYGAIVAIDGYLGSSLSYIILNVVKRAVVEDSNTASNEVPFQKTDIALCSFWGVLAVFGVALQLYCEWSRPPFPPPPYITRKREMELRNQRSISRRSRRRRNILIPPEEGSRTEERAPLLGSNPTAPNYLSTNYTED